MSKYKAVLIDLDGTLTDSSPGIYNAVHYSLEKLGWPIPTAETLRMFIGPPLIYSFRNYCNMPEDLAEQALVAYREYYGRQGLFENSVYDGIPQVLEALRKSGLKLVLATSKPEKFSERIMDRFNLTQYFDVFASASLDESRDTKSKVIAYAIEQLEDIDLTEIIMVGDRYHDVEGAAANGIKCIGVTYGYGTPEELLEAGAYSLAATPAELVTILLANP